jgi:hypothetical protein
VEAFRRHALNVDRRGEGSKTHAGFSLRRSLRQAQEGEREPYLSRTAAFIEFARR